MLFFTAWFCVLFAGILWLIAEGKNVVIKWCLITAMIIMVVGLYDITHFQLGYARTDLPPSRYQIHGIQTKVNDKIYILAEDLSKDTTRGLQSWFYDRDEYRMYSIPYTKPLHEEANLIKQRLKDGLVTIMSREGIEGEGNARGKGKNGQGKRGLHSGQYQRKSTSPLGYILPPPKPPAK